MNRRRTSVSVHLVVVSAAAVLLATSSPNASCSAFSTKVVARQHASTIRRFSQRKDQGTSGEHTCQSSDQPLFLHDRDESNQLATQVVVDDDDEVSDSRSKVVNTIGDQENPRKLDLDPLLTPKQAIQKFLEEPMVEVLDFLLVFGSSLLVAISTLPDLPISYLDPIMYTEAITGSIFFVEFLARWYASSKPRGTHFTQPIVMVDVVAVILPLLFATQPASFWDGVTWLPDWLTSASGLINLRLLRVLRLQRVLQDMDTFSKFEMALGIPSSNVKAYQLQLARVVLSIFTLLSVSSGLIYTVEHGVNPDITDYFTALYFGLTTLTTVGFGDITPVTWQGKFVVSASILAGVAVIPAQAAVLVEALLARQEFREAKENDMTDNADDDDKTVGVKNSAAAAVTDSTPSEGRSRNSDTNMVLETGMQCPACGVAMHWSSAKFCYSCGERL